MMNVNIPEGCLQGDYLFTCSNVTVCFKKPKEKNWTLCNKLQYNGVGGPHRQQVNLKSKEEIKQTNCKECEVPLEAYSILNKTFLFDLSMYPVAGLPPIRVFT